MILSALVVLAAPLVLAGAAWFLSSPARAAVAIAACMVTHPHVTAAVGVVTATAVIVTGLVVIGRNLARDGVRLAWPGPGQVTS